MSTVVCRAQYVPFIKRAQYVPLKNVYLAPLSLSHSHSLKTFQKGIWTSSRERKRRNSVPILVLSLVVFSLSFSISKLRRSQHFLRNRASNQEAILPLGNMINYSHFFSFEKGRSTFIFLSFFCVACMRRRLRQKGTHVLVACLRVEKMFLLWC